MKMKFLFQVPLFLFLTSFTLPTQIDYGKIKGGTCGNTNETYWNLGALAFNGSPELATIFTYLKHAYNIKTVVETGTFQANSTVFFSYLFDEVHTIEIDRDTHLKAIKKFPLLSHVHFHLGSSDDVLKFLLPKLSKEPVLFYLDAHWQKHWPLRNELIEISKTHRDNCIIVIDDFKVPGRNDIPYDRFGANACSYPYIQSQLELVFSEYTMHFIIPKHPSGRAKFLAIPTSL
ncbi:MAG: class I SAM-dependent methyltransferase [Waddliaceae bacterium]